MSVVAHSQIGIILYWVREKVLVHCHYNFCTTLFRVGDFLDLVKPINIRVAAFEGSADLRSRCYHQCSPTLN